MFRYLKAVFPITLVVLLVAAFFSFRGEAQQPNSKATATASAAALKPISSTAVAFAESDAVRDMPDLAALSPDVTGDREGEERNPDNVAVAEFRRNMITAYRAAHPELKYIPSVDGAMQTRAPSPSLPSAPLANFDGLAAQDGYSTLNLTTVAPSDENLAVGPRDVVQATNVGFRIYDKAGNPKTAPKPIRALFSKLGGICAQAERGDPIVQHDRLADRWIISQFDFANANLAPFFECFAVSKTSDPTGSYYLYGFQTQTEAPPGTVGSGQNFPDYPHISTWIDGYYMSVNQFDRSKPSGTQFNGIGVYAFNRAKMLVGDPTATYVYFNLNLATHPEGIASIQPADIDGFTLPAAGQPCPFAYEISDEYEIPPFNKDGLRMFNFHADFTTPASSTFTERSESPVLLAPYDPRMPEFETGTRAECQQPPPATAADSLNAISYHLMYRLQYRRLGNNENLTSVFAVNVSGVQPTNALTYQAGFRYVQLRKTTAGGAYSVFDQATYAPDPVDPANGTDRFLTSAAIDNQGNLAVSYSKSSTTIFPSIAYAGRDFNAPGIPLGGLSGEQTLFTGTGVQRGTSNRWGDYQSLQVDPTDDCTFWTTNQYYNTTTLTFNWRTRIGSFKFPSCVAPDQGTIAGTVTSCETGAPISGALIQFSNGFSTTSGVDGRYSIQMASGAVATVTPVTMTVSNPSRLCNASQTISTGVLKDTTVTQDVCLTGTASPVLDTTDPNAVVITGGNGDGKINPSECNSLNVRLTNTGCATAKNLKATLTSSTPGVTISSPGTVPYGDIVIDGSGFNSVPFKVSTDASVSCTTVNFTLTTMFNGGTTTTNFSLPSACGTSPDVTTTGNLDSTDPVTPGNGRLGRDGVVATCSGKTCPNSLNATNNHYDVVPFTNSTSGPACVTITLDSPGGVNLIGASYNGVFNPANDCTNYAGDPGGSANGPVTWQETVPAGGVISVVVWEVNANVASAGAGTPYTITVSGFSGPAPAGGGACAVGLTTQVSAASVGLGQPMSDTATLTTGGTPTGVITFRLFGPNNATCSGTPVFTSVVGVNGDGTYASQPFVAVAPGTYNWVASYSGDSNNPAATGACGDANETTTVAGPSPTPTAPPSQALNLSTRMRTDTGNNVAIGGFTITGAVPKHVIIRAIGPSLTRAGLPAAEVLADPTLEVHGPGSFGTITNNNWRDSQEAQIKADGLAPTNDLESAIDATLPPGAYTAIIKGNGANPAGLCLFEVYDLDTAATSKLANLSSRALVGTGNNVVIAGFVLGNNSGNDRVVIRGLGPSLSAFGIANTLADPTLELRDENGVLILANNDWQDNAAQATEITAAGLAPSNAKESAIAATLAPGLYTAILAGSNNTTGVGTVEVYDRGP